MIEVRSPASDELLAEVPELGEPEVAELARRAREAQPHWEALGFEGRAGVLRALERALIDDADALLRTIVSETGKAYDDAQLTELAYTVSALSFWAGHAHAYLAERRRFARSAR